jgi:membrane peptidoglycan carboxypeptidase
VNRSLFFVFYILIIKSIMNIQRILISEQEKKSILGLYGVDKDLVNEQFNPTDGTYIIQKNQTLLNVTNNGKNIVIPEGTKVWHNFNGSDAKINLGNTGVYYDCSFVGYENIFTYEKTSGNVKNDSLSKVIRSTFCNGKTAKTWEEITGKKVHNINQKPKKIKLPNLTEKNFCNLPGDIKWDYAKIDDGTWYTRRKGQEEWIKLETPKFQGAINLLEKDSKCGNLEKISQTEIIPIDLKSSELQVNPKQQNLNTTNPDAIDPNTNLDQLPG